MDAEGGASVAVRALALHSPTGSPIVGGMHRLPARRPLLALVQVGLLGLAAACGGKPAAVDGREIAWTYGPTAGGATKEHLHGTGTKGGAPLAQGWQCRLQPGGRLVVRPYQPATVHPLYGKVGLRIGLFDQGGKQLAAVRTGVLTAAATSHEFELDAAVAAQLWDVVLWYSES